MCRRCKTGIYDKINQLFYGLIVDVVDVVDVSNLIRDARAQSVNYIYYKDSPNYFKNSHIYLLHLLQNNK